MKPALQLWTVREQLAENPEACIKRLASIGVEEVEGFDLLQLMSIYPLLKEYGITCRSSFVFWPHITGNVQVVHALNYQWLPHYWGIHHEIELAKYMNIDTLVMGYWHESERQSISDYYDLAEKLNMAGESCQQAGIRLLYHHHAFEFQPLGTEIPFTVLEQNTSSNVLNFELDTYWLEVTGQRSIDTLNRLGSRVKQLHLKSGVLPPKPSFTESEFCEKHFRSLVQGDLFISEIVKAGKAVGVDRFFVEQDASYDVYADVSESVNLLRILSTQ
jgi:sugar phosphate isomerase/epimerase